MLSTATAVVVTVMEGETFRVVDTELLHFVTSEKDLHIEPKEEDDEQTLLIKSQRFCIEMRTIKTNLKYRTSLRNIFLNIYDRY